jgi:hypothetical protein
VEARQAVLQADICGQEHFDEIERILREVLTEAWTRI